MNNNDKRPDPKPRKHPQLWQLFLRWDELKEMRKRHTLRISSIDAGKSNMDAQVERDFLEAIEIDVHIELAKEGMINFGANVGPIWEALTSIKGLGEGSLAAQLLAQIDDISKFATISKLWRFARYGLSEYWMKNNKVMAPKEGYQYDKDKKKVHVVTVPKNGWQLKTIADRNIEKWVSPFNKILGSVCWNIASQFLMQQSIGYADYYYDEKDRQRKNNPKKIKISGKWMFTDGHLHNRAKRHTAKLFLQHLWINWRTLEGLPVSKPYVHDILGHSNYIPPELCGWPVIEQPNTEKIKNVIAQAIERGETVPDEAYLVGSREPTLDEVKYGISLAEMAGELLDR